MHKAKQQLARAAERLRGVERRKFLLASAIVVGITLMISGMAILLANILQPTHSGSTNVVMSGQVTCLPYKNPGQPHVMVCAIGLRSDDNRYYELQNAPQPMLLNTGSRIQVTGTLAAPRNDAYLTDGVITVSSWSR